MNYLVTGSAGLVGRQVVKDLSLTNDEVYAAYHNAKPEHGIPILMDLVDSKSISENIEKIKPDVIIHLAAMTNVDLCETEQDLAMKINYTSTEMIAHKAATLGAFLVYVSTDYVFDGNKGMKKETDDPNPMGFYGKSKLNGETAIQNSNAKWCIARTSTPYGIHPTKKTFPIWIAENLQSNKEINVVTDQFTSPTYIPNLSQMLIEITQRRIPGLLHVAGATRISRYDLAELVAEKLNLDKNLLKKTSVDNIDWKAKRPKDSSLDVSLAMSLLKEKPLNIENGLVQLIQEIEKEKL